MGVLLRSVYLDNELWLHDGVAGVFFSDPSGEKEGISVEDVKVAGLHVAHLRIVRAIPITMTNACASSAGSAHRPSCSLTGSSTCFPKRASD